MQFCELAIFERIRYLKVTEAEERDEQSFLKVFWSACFNRD